MSASPCSFDPWPHPPRWLLAHPHAESMLGQLSVEEFGRWVAMVQNLFRRRRDHVNALNLHAVICARTFYARPPQMWMVWHTWKGRRNDLNYCKLRFADDAFQFIARPHTTLVYDCACDASEFERRVHTCTHYLLSLPNSALPIQLVRYGGGLNFEVPRNSLFFLRVIKLLHIILIGGMKKRAVAFHFTWD